MAPRTTRKTVSALALLALLSLGVWIVAQLFAPRDAPDGVEIAVRDAAVQAPDASAEAGTRVQMPRPLPKKPGQPSCRPAASVRCHQGDVWLFDSCGNEEEKLEECDARRCDVDACDEPYDRPCDEPLQGRCDGDTVRACLAGRPVKVDCAAQGLRCVVGDEGAECAPIVPFAERCREAPARCDGDVLVRCEQGRVVRTECLRERAACMTLPGMREPRCVELKPFALATGDCGPCGCQVQSSGNESICDGRDDDDNGLVDERLACGVVPIVAFIVTDSAGRTSHAREDVEAEVAAANRAFAAERAEDGIQFELAEVDFLADATLLDMTSAEFSKLVDDPRVHPERDQFYVPLVFTDSLGAGGNTPKAGVSTLPNGTCGGVQEGRGPDVGIIAVAKARSATTVAHELGHFLGLCHTHDQQVASLLAAQDASGALVACDMGCRGQGDGVCDTPFDPGPEQCAFDVTCQTACRTPAVPDTFNLMSYYTSCRQRFTEQQMLLMQHTLALRRGWRPCLGGLCPCSLGGDECPVGMSCLPVTLGGGERSTRCMLAGPRRPGSSCEQASDCGPGALCMTDEKSRTQRCVRACTASSPGCNCTSVGTGLMACLEDLLP